MTIPIDLLPHLTVFDGTMAHPPEPPPLTDGDTPVDAYADPSFAFLASFASSTPDKSSAPQPLSISENDRLILDPPALHGLAGDIVGTLEPHTEADPAAILAQFLVAFGNAVGRSPHALVESTSHQLNTNALIVGRTSRARKGTSLDRVKALMRLADSDWVDTRIVGGLSSGEGLLWAVRDEPENGGAGTVRADDKRLLVVESEFANVLKVMAREGNSLSPMVRHAFDSGNLRVLTKNSPIRATDVHISIIGHITSEELLRYLNQTEMANGFANRFLFFHVRRSKELPEGGFIEPNVLGLLASRISKALAFARGTTILHRDPSARTRWAEIYRELTVERAGVVGALTARAEAHVLRLSLLFAVLEQSQVVRVEHLDAALAVWRFCDHSIVQIFGEKFGDPTADAIHDALLAAPHGLKRSELYNIGGRHIGKEKLSVALAALVRSGRATSVSEPTGGAPLERWFSVTDAKQAKEAKEGGSAVQSRTLKGLR
jgi:hypothetical protein